MDSLDLSAAIRSAFQDRYEVQALIGHGGFGQVYKARQLTTEQEVAIKVLKPPPPGDDHLLKKQAARFRREMRICSKLFHPSIVRPLESGSTPDGLLYSIFQFVPGETLAALLAREGALEPREAIRLMLQVLDALNCAHRRGVVHRDIKPQNIMVTDTGARRNALILDFGISTFCEEFRRSGDSISSTFEVVGTPAYAAPEQLRGQPSDMRSDLYSWGLVFLECLSGERVIHGRTIEEVLQKQLGPEQFPIPAMLEGLRLGRLLQRVTAKDVERRDASTEELIRELEVCEQEEGGVLARRFALARAEQGAMPRKASRAMALNSEGECRQLTVLCFGVTLLQSHSAQAMFEEIDGILSAFQAECIRLAESLGGYVASVLADRTLVYFGYPIAREDAPRVAARAAMKIVEEAARRSAELEFRHGLRIEVRAGLHTGMVLLQSSRGAEQGKLLGIQGTTPMIATRLQELAEPGEVLLGLDAQRLLRSQFAIERIGLKGGAVLPPQLTEVFRLVTARGEEQGVKLDTSMVGRAQELEVLLQRWSLVRQGAGQAMLVMGEPGIGKTRLVHELRVRLRGTPYTLLECRCAPEERNSPMRPIIEMLEHLLGRIGEWPAEKARSKLEALLGRYEFELPSVMPLFAALLSIPLGERYPPLQVTPDWQKALTFEALLDLLVEMSTHEPVLMVIEDLHWADPTTLEQLTFLLDTVPTTRLCVLCTARPEFLPPWPAAQFFQLHLGRLDRARVDEMINGLAGARTLPEELRERVAARTDGIPLFVEELTRMVLESGALEKEAERYRLVGSVSEVSIPCTLRGLLEARLDRLGRAKETAAVAAALGREFSYELLCKVFPRDERSLQAELATLVESDLLQLRRRHHRQMYVFKHVLIREAAYESLPRNARRKLHARIARVLAEHFPQLAQTQPELLAHHYTEAAQTEPAITHWLAAGKRDLLHSANAEAIEHLSRGLALLKTLPASPERDLLELEAQMTLGFALIICNYADPEVERTFARAHELCQHVGKSPQLFLVLDGLYVYYLVRCKLEQTLELARQMLCLGEALSSQPIIQGAHIAFGVTYFYRGEFSTSLQHLEQGLALVGSEHERSWAMLTRQDVGLHCHVYMGFALWFLGYPDRALKQCQESIELARRRDNPFNLTVVLNVACALRQIMGDREGARAWIEEEVKLSEEHAYTWWLIWTRLQLGWLLIAEPERAEEGESLLRRGCEDFRAQGPLIGMSQVLLLVAESFLQRGRLDEARRAIDRAFENWRAMGEAQFGPELYLEPELYRLDGELILASGTGTEAQAEGRFTQALAVARNQGSRSIELRAVLSLCRLWHRQGRSAEAYSLLSEVYGGFTEGFETPDLRKARALLTELEATMVRAGRGPATGAPRPV